MRSSSFKFFLSFLFFFFSFLVTLYMVVRFSAVHSNVSPPISLSLSSRSSFFFLLFCERFGAALTEAWPPFFLAVGGS